MKINNQIVTLLTDNFDEIIIKYYNYKNGLNLENPQETKNNVIEISYLEAISNVLELYMNNETIVVDEENQEEVDKLVYQIEECFDNNIINSEEIRKALLLIIIKGFKQVNFSLDLITPDALGLILVHIVEAYIQKDNIKILDPNVGTGNLMFLLNNFLNKEIQITGIDNHNILIKLFASIANFMQMDFKAKYEDALTYAYDGYDILITDVASYNHDLLLMPSADIYESELSNKKITYFPYLLIEKYIKTNIHKQIYIIDSNFFEQNYAKEFNKYLHEHAIIRSLIALPESMFVNKSCAKSIMIIEPKTTENSKISTGIYVLPSLLDTSKLKDVLTNIKNDLRK